MTSTLTSPTVRGSARRAAVALVALGPHRCRQVLATLDEQCVRTVAAEIAVLGEVSTSEVREAVAALASGLAGEGPLPAPGRAYAKDLLVAALGADRGAQAALELDAGRPFTWLGEADPEQAAQLLAAEPAGAVALALAHLDPRSAARLLTRLPEEQRASVATRVATLASVHPDTLEEVETGLRSRFGAVPTVEPERLAGPQLLAQMLAQASGPQEKALLQALAASSPDLAEAVRAALFTFDDALSLEARSMQALLKAVDTRDLAVALHNAPEHLAERVFANLSERARGGLQEEISLLVRVRSNDVVAARARVVVTARELIEQGAIELSREDSEEPA